MLNKVSILCLLLGVAMTSQAARITARAGTLEAAEAIIAAQAARSNSSYKIIEASNNNSVHMTALLSAKETDE